MHHQHGGQSPQKTSISIRLDMKMTLPGIVLGTYVTSLDDGQSSLDLQGDSLRFDVKSLELEESRYNMDLTESPISPGFDMAHMSLDNINIKARGH